MNHSINFCPKSEALLPEYGRSAFVRAAVIAYAALKNGALTPAPPPIEVNAEPVAWVRTWHRPRTDLFPDGFDFSTLIWDKSRGVSLNSPPWPFEPRLNMEQARSWRMYVDKWRFPDPFPGPLEWHSMGEPAEPLPEHRVIVEPETVEPLPVVVLAPSQESPLPAAVLPVVGMSLVEPLPVVGVSINSVLEEV